MPFANADVSSSPVGLAKRTCETACLRELRFDANTNTAANDQFDWIGTDAFSGLAGELRARSVADGVIVEADTNGDATADFSIKLLNTYNITLTADVFGL